MSPSQYVLAKVIAGIVSPFAPHDERNVLRRFCRFAGGLSLPLAEQYFTYRSLFSPGDLGRLLTGDFVSQLNLDAPHKWFCDLYENPELADEITQAQHDDLMTYLPDDLLVKTDMAAMASSLELRAPMLQPSLVEAGLSLSQSLKVSTRIGKVALRKAFADMLPPAIMTKRKRGFAVPLDRWLREDLLETMKDALFDPDVERLGIIRPEAIAGLVNDHLSRRGDHRHRLWALLVLTRWLARHS
jgi:asparagine synthase (glutamine-hydrolysing)